MAAKQQKSGPPKPLYPKWGGGGHEEGDCPRCGQNWLNNRMAKLGYCILCAIDEGTVNVPVELQAKGWRLSRSCNHCITAVCHEKRLSLPLFSSFQVDECVQMAERYQAAWEWFHEGGAGYAWGWRLRTMFHIKHFAEHPALGRIPRPRHDEVWLSELPELIIEQLVVEGLGLQYHRRKVAAVVAALLARRQLAERARNSAAAFAAIPIEAFEQKELL